jgi:hypothetical protein
MHHDLLVGVGIVEPIMLEPLSTHYAERQYNSYPLDP